MTEQVTEQVTEQDEYVILLKTAHGWTDTLGNCERVTWPTEESARAVRSDLAAIWPDATMCVVTTHQAERMQLVS